jgi:hypothetical protein
MKKFSHLVILCMLIGNFPVITTGQTPIYTVVTLPKKANCSKQQLNTEVSHAKSRDEVRRIIRSKNFPPLTLVIRILNPNTSFSWWTIDTGTNEEKIDNAHIDLQSMTINFSKPYHVEDLNKFSADTLALIDNLRFAISAKAAAYSSKPYYAILNCGNENKKIQLSLTNNELIIPYTLFAECTDTATKLSLYNEADITRALGSTYFVLLNSDRKETLLQMAEFIKKTDKNKSYLEIAAEINGYAREQFGVVPAHQLTDWLKENLDQPIKNEKKE